MMSYHQQTKNMIDKVRKTSLCNLAKKKKLIPTVGPHLPELVRERGQAVPGKRAPLRSLPYSSRTRLFSARYWCRVFCALPRRLYRRFAVSALRCLESGLSHYFPPLFLSLLLFYFYLSFKVCIRIPGSAVHALLVLTRSPCRRSRWPSCPRTNTSTRA